MEVTRYYTDYAINSLGGVITSPYLSCGQNFKITFTSFAEAKTQGISLCDRVVHFTAAFFLLFPLLNIITYIVLRAIFGIDTSSKGTSATSITQKTDPKETEWFNQNHMHHYFSHLHEKDQARFAMPSNAPYLFTSDTLMTNLQEQLDSETKGGPQRDMAYYLLTGKDERKNHWTLVYIDRKKKSVEYYDSKVNYANMDEMQTSLKAVADVLKEHDESDKPYEVLEKVQTVLQPDGYQCGPWTLCFLENRLQDPNFDPNKLDPSQIATFRKSVCDTLEKKGINLDPEKAPDIEEAIKASLQEKEEVIEPLEGDPLKWFNNSEIDTYFRFLAKRHPDKITFPPFMTGISIDALKTELSQHPLNQGTDTPICLCIGGNHWGLVYINQTKKEIQFYDSKVNYGEHEKIMTGLREIARPLGFNPVAKITKKLQPDWYQCGPWTCYFLQELLKDPNVDFNTLDIHEAQKIVAHHRKVVNGTLAYVTRKKEEKKKRARSFFTQAEMNQYIRHLHKETNASFQEPKETPTPLTFDTIADKIRSDLESEKKNLVYPIQVYDRFWTILYIDRALGTIEYYDSQVIAYDDAPTKLFEIAQLLQNNDKKEFTVHEKIQTLFSDEMNHHQTGPWALYFLENRLNNPDFNPNTDDPEAASNHQRVAIKFRKKIYKALESTSV